MLYYNHLLGAYLASIGRTSAFSLYRGPEQIRTGYEQKQIGIEEIEVGEDENHLPIFETQPIYGDNLDRPIYEDGRDQYELMGWESGWGAAPTESQITDFAASYVPPVEPSPFTEFEMAVQQTRAILAGREEQAKGDITNLKSTVAVTLVATGAHMADGTLITGDNVNAEGSRFVVWHAALISAYKDAGGNPEAGQALYDSIAGAPSKAAFPWLTDAVLAIFSATLLVESPAP